MATGIPFPEANLVLRAPTPEDAAAGTVYDLHVHRYRDLDGQANVISKWQFSPAELAAVVASGGAFWFNCWGETHPPIWITGQNPFVRASRREDRPADNSQNAIGEANSAGVSIENAEPAGEDPVLKFIDDYLSPWGSWKTPWWEAEMGDAAFSDHNALKHVANMLRRRPAEPTAESAG